MFQTIHKTICCSEVVYMESSHLSEKGSKLFILYTLTECGALPLGLIISSSISLDNLITGLQMLKITLSNSIFNGKVEGPQVFMTDDCNIQRKALATVWPTSTCLLSGFYTLRSVYKWLVNKKNKIPSNVALCFYNEFKRIISASTLTKCEQEYENAVQGAVGFQNYLEYLNEFWERRDIWAFSFRTQLFARNNIISEAALYFLKDKIFSCVKSFNNIQLIDFLLTTFVDFCQAHLPNACNGKLIKDKLLQTIKLPIESYISNIQKLEDYVYIVPSDDLPNAHYVVFTDILICTCSPTNSYDICKHIDWLHILYHMLYYSDKYQRKIVKTENGNNSTEVPTTSDEFHASDNPNVLNKNYNLEDGHQLISKFSQYLTQWVNVAPSETMPALQKMVEQAEKAQNINSFISACASFASGK